MFILALLNRLADVFLGLRCAKAKADFVRRAILVMQPKSEIFGVGGQMENPNCGVRKVRFAELTSARIDVR